MAAPQTGPRNQIEQSLVLPVEISAEGRDALAHQRLEFRVTPCEAIEHLRNRHRIELVDRLMKTLQADAVEHVAGLAVLADSDRRPADHQGQHHPVKPRRDHYVGSGQAIDQFVDGDGIEDACRDGASGEHPALR